MGKPEADGRIRLDLTYEDMTQEMAMNGQPTPIPAQTAAGIKGKTISMWIDAKFQVLDVKAPEGFPIPIEQLKMMMTQMMASMPHQEMRVGETVTTALSMPLPLPGGAGATLTGETKTTLVKVSNEGSDQVATLEQSVDAAVDATNDIPSGKLRVQFKIAGTGTTATAVKAGLVRASTMKSTMEGTFEQEGGDGPRPGMKMSGTMTIALME